MSSIKLYKPTGEAGGDVAFDDALLVVDRGAQAVKDVVVATMNARRAGTASSLSKGEVAGSNKKPWKQKGTGRARFGSSRNPIWRGGGIVFGPTGEENYSKKLPVAAKRRALRQALTLASKDGRIAVLEKLTVKDGKTAELAKLLAKIDATRSIMLIVTEKTPELVRAAANLGSVSVVSATYVNTYGVLNADRLVFTADALKATEAWLKGDK